MKVLLLKDVYKLGHAGDVKKVADGYGRNYLLPKRLAIEATAGNRAVIEQMKVSSQRRSDREKADAEGLSKQLEGATLSFARKSGEHDHLFGSVTSGDIADALASQGFTVDRRKIQLDEPLKNLGEFAVAIKLHRDITATVKVVVAKEAE